jgi:hypothetical protein
VRKEHGGLSFLLPQNNNSDDESEEECVQNNRNRNIDDQIRSKALRSSFFSFLCIRSSHLEQETSRSAVEETQTSEQQQEQLKTPTRCS